MSVIDKTEEIEKLRRRYGRDYHRSDEAVIELRALWGCQSNEHGVTNYREEIIARIGRCEAILKFTKTDHGYWLLGASMSCAISGKHYAPSVFSSIGYASYQDAHSAGIEKIISFFENVMTDENGCSSKSNRHNAQKMVEALKSARTPQLSLFDIE